MKLPFTLLLIACCVTQLLPAQSPGLIVRPAGGNGITSLNPDGNGYSSSTTAGFTTDDIAQSELAFKVVPALMLEPTGDLLTGPSGGFTDIVTKIDGSGFYIYKDATNIYFRLRIGGIISGSKGYSVLIDTDNKVGSSGANADPGYVAPAGNSPGNPGFEYEVVLQTNFQVAVYNINGTATPGAPVTYALPSNSQISVALSKDGNNPDYFYDWFIPLSAIGNPSSIRMVTTTVTSPNSALQGTRSDIYGIDDRLYANTAAAWELVANGQPPTDLTTFTGVGPVCTAAPAITAPVSTGPNITVNGTWSRLDASKPSSATITIYKNGVAAGTTSATSGAGWSIIVSSIASGDVLYAQAQATGESKCLQSNSVTASGCITLPTAPVLTCASLKGISGTMPSTASGNTVVVYLVPTTNASPVSNPVSTGVNLTYPGATAFAFYTDGCSGGTNNVATGMYMIVTQNSGCSSAPVFVCVSSGSSGTPPPLTTNALTITQPVYPQQTSINGSGSVSGDILRLFINGQYKASITATGTSFTFSGLTLSANDQLRIYSQTGTSCMTQSALFTVSCYLPSPSITTNATGNLLTGATVISGTSAFPGASVQLYKGAGVAVGSAVTVNSSGNWTATVPALTNAEVYYATQTYSGCTSANSATATVLSPAACPVITGSYTDASTTITGTLPASFTGTVRLYLDDVQVGSQAVTSATSWSITVAAGTLYYNGVLKATAQASGGAESPGCTAVTVGCTSPLTPSISPVNSSIHTGQSVIFTVNNVSANSWYALYDNSGTSYATSLYKTTGSSFSLTSNTFSSVGTYNLKLSADALTGCPQSFSVANISVSATLPVHFISVNAVKKEDKAEITWKVDNEVSIQQYIVERSTDGRNFQPVGTVAYRYSPGINTYSYIDDPASATLLYYRIKQVDIDGQYTYSTIVSLLTTTISTLKIIPNPATDQLTLGIAANRNETGRIQLVSMNGKIMLTQPVALREGTNTVLLTRLNRFARGNYIVSIKTSSGVTHNKLILQ